MTTLTVQIRVKPGASRTKVGGTHGDALVVAVASRAVEGAATAHSLKAIAAALGLRPRQVELVRGERSRDKTVAITVDDGAVISVVKALEELGAKSVEKHTR